MTQPRRKTLEKANRAAAKALNRHLFQRHGRQTAPVGSPFLERIRFHDRLHEGMCDHRHEPLREEEDLTQYAERAEEVLEDVAGKDG